MVRIRFHGRKAASSNSPTGSGSVALLLGAFALVGCCVARTASAQCPTSFTLTSSANPSLLGQAVTFTFTVSPVTYSDRVTFLDGTSPVMERVPLVNGIATYTTAALTVGTHTIIAETMGPTCFLGKTIYQVVNVPAGDLAVRLCGPTYFASPEGNEGSYTATVTNRGSQPATGVALHLMRPVMEEATPSQGQCPLTPDGVDHCDLGTLNPSGTATVTFHESDLSPGDTVQVLATSGGLPDPAPDDNWTSITITSLDCDNLSQACPILADLALAICEGRFVDTCSGFSPATGPPATTVNSLRGLSRRAQAAASIDVQSFYGLRDKVFGTSPSGRRYTQLYYEYGSEVTGHLLANPALAAQSLAALGLWQDNVQALASGHGASAVITSEQITALNTFIESLKSSASPELRAVLSREQAALNLPSLVGKTMLQAWLQQQQTAPATITLPASASIHGLNGSFFHSDVRILNPSATSSVTATLRYRCFTGSCPNNVQPVTLAPREMKSLDDIVGTLFNAPESAGPIEIMGDVIVDSRLYTPSRPSPTTGASVPGFAADEALADSVLLSLSHSVDRSRGFRTNAGAYNPSGDSLSVTFSVFDPTGKPMGQTSRNVGPFSAVQVNDLFGSSGITRDVDNAYCVVKADDIHELFAYATVIDNQSQDQVFVKGRNARGVPSGTVTLPTAASIHGLNGSFFHSDIRVFNPSATASTTVRATYRCFTGSCPTSPQTFTVAPREMKVFDDAVVTLFSAPDSAGPIELTGAVVVDSRIYSPEKPAATTGDDVPALREDQAAATLVLTSLSKSVNPAAGFRTNVGVYNPSIFPLTVTLSIYGPSGQFLGKTTRSLDGQSATQINDVFGAAGITGDIPNAYCITSGDGIGTPFGLGNFFTYATVIDNQSQDTTLVVGKPLGAGLAGAGSQTSVASAFGAGAGGVIPFVILAGALLRRREPLRKETRGQAGHW